MAAPTSPISDDLLPPPSVELLPASVDASRVLELYPPSPDPCPALGATTAAYRLRVVVVLASLVVFFAFYLGLLAGTAYLVYLAWQLEGFGLLRVGAVAGAAMLFLFVLKGLFKRSKLDVSDMVEVSEVQQPLLFAFIRKLCEESSSGFPGRIYLSPDVNAGVFYPRSLVSLIWPVRKHLVVGLGLINALNLSELKAVLAHEFGHFAQSSMRLGRYVYVANQVMHDIVFARDFWDRWLNKWCQIDLRLSFPAWGLKLVVWLLRKALGAAFKGINLLNHALSRQMEFDADLNAVRLTGSDALISALWKVERASIAWNMAADELGSVSMHGTFSDDLFYHQSRALERLEELSAKNPRMRQEHASLFQPYRHGAEIHFSDSEDHAGDMWSTHPPNRERELNAKRLYLSLPEDGRHAWSLLTKKKATRNKLTRLAYRHAGRDMAGKKLQPARDVHRQVLEERQEMDQAEHYHGLYDDRFVHAGNVGTTAKKIDKRHSEGSLDVDALRRKAARYTGRRLEKLLERRSAVAKRGAVLAALSAGQIDESAAEKALDGERLRNSSVEADLAEATREQESIDARLEKIDRAVFRYFYAKSVDHPAERRELMARYHFLLSIQERIARLNDIERSTQPVLEAVAAGAELSPDDARYAIAVFHDGHSALAETLSVCDDMALPALFHLEDVESVRAFVLDEPAVEAPPSESITGEWIGAYWRQLSQTLGRLRKLHFKNLGALLRLQEQLDPSVFGRAGGLDGGLGG
jgi:Zn-dependent protease with chaperone function